MQRHTLILVAFFAKEMHEIRHSGPGNATGTVLELQVTDRDRFREETLQGVPMPLA